MSESNKGIFDEDKVTVIMKKIERAKWRKARNQSLYRKHVDLLNAKDYLGSLAEAMRRLSLKEDGEYREAKYATSGDYVVVFIDINVNFLFGRKNMREKLEEIKELEMFKDLYLHKNGEYIFDVVRVYGGLIYRTFLNKGVSSVFVPTEKGFFDDEPKLMPENHKDEAYMIFNEKNENSFASRKVLKDDIIAFYQSFDLDKIMIQTKDGRSFQTDKDIEDTVLAFLESAGFKPKRKN